MQNFTYFNPTELMFGRDTHKQIGKRVAEFVPAGTKVLVVYGGRSAKKSGVLDAVMQSCREAGLDCVELGGVQPNPKVELVRECIDVIRAQNVGLLLAVGGGSVIDTAKAAAMGAVYDGDVWDFYCGKAVPKAALPVCTVLTIPAAGSEQSIRTVISNGSVKAGAGNSLVRPKVSAVNPELFFTLPDNQISAGVIDMMSHIMERYFTNTSSVDYTSAQAEAALRVIMANGVKLMGNKCDYDAWSQVGLAGSFAHNGYFGLGHVEDWACHGMEHALSGWDDTITHGDGLAVITPAWMKYVWSANPTRFVQFAREVMGVRKEGSDEEIINAGIEAFVEFLKAMKLPTTLGELADGEVPIDLIAEKAAGKAPLGNFRRLGKEDVKAILELAR